MNLHLVPDDKYVSRLIQRVEEIGLSNENEFIVKTAPPFKYLKKGNLKGGNPGSAEFATLHKDLSSYKKIFIHFMDETSIRWIAANNLKDVYWLVWGADIYETMFSGFEPNDGETQKVLAPTWRNKINRALYATVQKVKNRSLYRNAYKRVKYTCNWIYDEYQFAVDHLPGLRSEHRFFIYDQDIAFHQLATRISLTAHTPGKELRVQLGQSVTAPGNHASALLMLGKAKGISEVVIPASYGSDFYRSQLEKWVKAKEFPFNIEFNKEYMQFDQYVEQLNTFDVLALNSIRPAGMGNFWLGIILGKAVLLRRENLACRMMEELGLTFYYIDEWCGNVRLPSAAEVEKNREICLQYYSEDRMRNAYRELFE